MSLTYASVCSGIEAPGIATRPLGWRPLWFAEIAPFPSAVLAHHYPDVQNYGDFTTLIKNPPASPDVLIGGTPCQSFSVAGLRGGLTDHRGNLALAFMALVDVLRPRWLLWENVPGVLSSNGGRDFGSILGALGKLGYGFAYRVLDAQFFGLAQRRKRVFLVGYSGDWRRPAAALFEPESLRGDSPPRRGSGAGVTGAVGTGASGGGGWRVGADEAAANQIVPAVRAFGGNDTTGPRDTATALTAKGGTGRMDFESETFVASIQDARPRSRGQNSAGVSTDGVSYMLDTANTQAVAYQCHGSNVGEMGTLRSGSGSVAGGVPFVAHALKAKHNSDHRANSETYIAHTLRGTGHDAREDGTGSGVAGAPAGCLGGRGAGDSAGQAPRLQAVGLRASDGETARSLNAHPTRMDLDTETFVAHTLRGDGHDASEDGTGRGVPLVPVAFAHQTCGDMRLGWAPDSSTTPALQRSQGLAVALSPGDRGLSVDQVAGGMAVPTPTMGVRRLSCTEMERLQGFPDSYTRIPYRGKPAEQCPDGPRAKALGNSMATNVIRWLCERIEIVDAIPTQGPQ